MHQRLAQRLAVQVGHLVGADDDGFGKLCGHRMGLGQCQAQCQGGRCFARLRGFVDIGRGGFKRESKTREQLVPVAGGGAQNKGAGRVGFRHAQILLHWRA
ncbi:hypothetical protein D3C71_1614970 [compost metagenome]